jgi:virulence-associated protein VagC
MNQIKSIMTLCSGKIIEKSIIEPCEKDDESIFKSKEEVEPEHFKEKTDFPQVLPFSHVITN